MAIIVGTFVLILGIVYGVYWFFVERQDAGERLALRKRLKRPTAKSVVTEALLKDKERLSDLGALDALLNGMGRITEPMQRTISQSGLNVTVSTVLLGSACVVAWRTSW